MPTTFQTWQASATYSVWNMATSNEWGLAISLVSFLGPLVNSDVGEDMGGVTGMGPRTG
jgi:hypothetical protein